MKKVYLWTILVLMLLGTLEILMFAGLHSINYMRPWLFREDFIARHFASLTDEDFRRFRRGSYDPLLGWDSEPNSTQPEINTAGRVVVASYDPDGARRDGLPAKVNLVAAYGDSFTKGAEVNDDETWPFYLERQLGYEVKNFGVGGYGTDQALLKFERNVAHGETSPIVILGIYEENINRILNQFRPFYLQATRESFGFKPAFRIQEGHLVLVPNLLSPEAASVFEAEEIARKLIQTDYWAKLNLRNHFPCILQIPSLLGVVWQELVQSKLAYPTWHDDRVSNLMSMIVNRFVATAEAGGMQTVVLFIPSTDRWWKGRREPSYEDFKDELRRRHPNVTIIDVAEHEFDEERFNISPFAGHASAYGNERIAHFVAQGLRWKGYDFAELSRSYPPAAD